MNVFYPLVPLLLSLVAAVSALNPPSPPPGAERLPVRGIQASITFADGGAHHAVVENAIDNKTDTAYNAGNTGPADVVVEFSRPVKLADIWIYPDCKPCKRRVCVNFYSCTSIQGNDCQSSFKSYQGQSLDKARYMRFYGGANDPPMSPRVQFLKIQVPQGCWSASWIAFSELIFHGEFADADTLSPTLTPSETKSPTESFAEVSPKPTQPAPTPVPSPSPNFTTVAGTRPTPPASESETPRDDDDVRFEQSGSSGERYAAKDGSNINSNNPGGSSPAGIVIAGFVLLGLICLALIALVYRVIVRLMKAGGGSNQGNVNNQHNNAPFPTGPGQPQPHQAVQSSGQPPQYNFQHNII